MNYYCMQIFFYFYSFHFPSPATHVFTSFQVQHRHDTTLHSSAFSYSYNDGYINANKCKIINHFGGKAAWKQKKAKKFIIFLSFTIIYNNHNEVDSVHKSCNNFTPKCILCHYTFIHFIWTMKKRGKIVEKQKNLSFFSLVFFY